MDWKKFILALLALGVLALHALVGRYQCFDAGKSPVIFDSLTGNVQIWLHHTDTWITIGKGELNKK